MAQASAVSPDLRHRLTFGFPLAGGIIGLLAWDLTAGGHHGLLILTVVTVVLGAREFRRLAATQAAEARLAPMVLVATVLAVLPHLETWSRQEGPLGALCAKLAAAPVAELALALGLAWTVTTQMARYAVQNFTANLGATVLGMLYLGVSFNLLGRIAMDDDPVGRGTWLLLAFVAAVKFGDITAYFGGRAFGRHKMAPRISPGKTWEGFTCSFVGAVGGSYLVHAISLACGGSAFAGWWQPAVWGIVLGPLGVLGDLAESALKRDAQVKDSGSMLPGFGGWLDLLDALLLAAPIGFLLSLVV